MYGTDIISIGGLTMKQRLYVDMDGTIAVWGNSAWEEVCSKGYFLHRPPMMNVIQAIKEVVRSHPNVEVFILSAALQNDYAVPEKNAWLDKYLPEIDKDHRVFSVYGEDKGKYINQKGDILLDDYSKNLVEWEAKGGKGIKILNGVNWSKKSWKGDVVFHETNPKLLAESIVLLGTRGQELEKDREISHTIPSRVKDFNPKEYMDNSKHKTFSQKCAEPNR